MKKLFKVKEAGHLQMYILTKWKFYSLHTKCFITEKKNLVKLLETLFTLRLVFNPYKIGCNDKTNALIRARHVSEN